MCHQLSRFRRGSEDRIGDAAGVKAQQHVAHDGPRCRVVRQHLAEFVTSGADVGGEQLRPIGLMGEPEVRSVGAVNDPALVQGRQGTAV